jgi:hypothetical protein
MQIRDTCSINRSFHLYYLWHQITASLYTILVKPLSREFITLKISVRMFKDNFIFDGNKSVFFCYQLLMVENLINNVLVKIISDISFVRNNQSECSLVTKEVME